MKKNGERDREKESQGEGVVEGRGAGGGGCVEEKQDKIVRSWKGKNRPTKTLM